jgi:hypothetical protein
MTFPLHRAHLSETKPLVRELRCAWLEASVEEADSALDLRMG